LTARRSGQIVTLESVSGTPSGQIVGISRDHAHLLVEELGENGQPSGPVHDLHPDGNSFDFFHGLLKSKA